MFQQQQKNPHKNTWRQPPLPFHVNCMDESVYTLNGCLWVRTVYYREDGLSLGSLCVPSFSFLAPPLLADMRVQACYCRCSTHTHTSTFNLTCSTPHVTVVPYLIGVCLLRPIHSCLHSKRTDVLCTRLYLVTDSRMIIHGSRVKHAWSLGPFMSDIRQGQFHQTFTLGCRTQPFCRLRFLGLVCAQSAQSEVEGQTGKRSRVRTHRLLFSSRQYSQRHAMAPPLPATQPN